MITLLFASVCLNVALMRLPILDGNHELSFLSLGWEDPGYGLYLNPIADWPTGDFIFAVDVWFVRLMGFALTGGLGWWFVRKYKPLGAGPSGTTQFGCPPSKTAFPTAAP